jgi:hypothetical protein
VDEEAAEEDEEWEEGGSAGVGEAPGTDDEAAADEAAWDELWELGGGAAPDDDDAEYMDCREEWGDAEGGAQVRIAVGGQINPL